jgi:hypothetical protein
MFIESLESRVLFAAVHTTFVEGATAFAEIVQTNGADIHEHGSANGAIVAQARPVGQGGKPLAILVSNSAKTTLVIAGAPAAL